jgi:hypothetical protein
MEFISDTFGLREEGGGKISKRTAEIHGDIFHIFSAWYVSKLGFQSGLRLTESDVDQVALIVINDHGNKLSFSPSVFIEANGGGPRGIDPFLAGVSELFVEGTIDGVVRNEKGISNTFEVDEFFACFTDFTSEALGGFSTREDAFNGFSKGAEALRARESSFKDFQPHGAASDQSITNSDPATIVNSLTESGTAGTDFSNRDLLAGNNSLIPVHV